MDLAQQGCKMTREEAKQYIYELYENGFQKSDLGDCLDTIYDDFEEELKRVYKDGIKDEARCHQLKDNQ